MNAIVSTAIANGLGESYHSLYTAYVAMQEIKQLGYTPKFCLHYKQNYYYPLSYPIDHIFDLSPFGEDMLLIDPANIGSKFIDVTHPSLKNCTLQIFVDTVTPEILNYKYRIYALANYRRFVEQNIPVQILDIQFLSKEVLDIKEQIINDKKHSLGGLIIRVYDKYTDLSAKEPLADEIYKKLPEYVIDYCNNSKQDHIFLSSNSRLLAEYLKSLHSKIFLHNFTHNFEAHCSKDFAYNLHGSLDDDRNLKLIKHTQEIAATMAVFADCKNFELYDMHTSSFACYGVLHNKYNRDYLIK